MSFHFSRRSTVLACAAILIACAQPGPAAMVVFQDGFTNQFTGGLAYSGTQDTTLWQTNPTDNTGGRDALEIGPIGSSQIRRSLIRFGVTNMLGQYQSINSITLRLTSVLANNTNTLQAFRLSSNNAAWVEGANVNFATPDTSLSTWNSRLQASNSWAGSAGLSTPGTDYITNVVASALFQAAVHTNGVTLDLVFQDVSFFDQWVSGTNSGLLLRTLTEPGALQRYIPYASDYGAVPSFRPQLIVDFEVIPEPGSALAVCVVLGAAATRRERKHRGQNRPNT